MKLFVAIPLCDYEPITSTVWSREFTYFIVEQCLKSFGDNISTPLDLCILADRCSDKFIAMAEKILKRFNPKTIDNSNVQFGLQQTSVPEKHQHVLNQFLKTIELAQNHDVLYFCEQDYLFKKDALVHALAAFDEIPQVNLLSMFDHPGNHDPSEKSQPGDHQHFRTRLSEWKSVASINGNWLWRVNFIKKRYDWLVDQCLNGALDYRITNSLYKEGELLLSPAKSLIQHIRLDGKNSSPTFGFCPLSNLIRPIGVLLSFRNRILHKLRKKPYWLQNPNRKIIDRYGS